MAQADHHAVFQAVVLRLLSVVARHAKVFEDRLILLERLALKLRQLDGARTLADRDLYDSTARERRTGVDALLDDETGLVLVAVSIDRCQIQPAVCLEL